MLKRRLKTALELLKAGQYRVFFYQLSRQFKKRPKPPPLKITLLRLKNEQVEKRLDLIKRSPGRVTVLIPVFNSHLDVRNCLDSVFRHTCGNFRVLVVDDASTEPEIPKLLGQYACYKNFQVHKNDSNLGFVKSVNAGFNCITDGSDILFLNSGTIVTPRWLKKLRWAAYSNENIATVTPFSNVSGAFSVPESGVNSELPLELNPRLMAKIVEDQCHHLYPDTRTGNGFSLYIKAQAHKEIGPFDVENFCRGYGEENDFFIRASQRGWRHIIDDSTFIYHKGRASFGDEKNEFRQIAKRTFDRKHPGYQGKVKKFLSLPELAGNRARIKSAMSNRSCIIRAYEKNILFVIHSGDDGASKANFDLLHAISPNYRCFLLESTAKIVTLSLVNNDSVCVLMKWRLSEKWSAKNFHSSELKTIYFNVLSSLHLDLVHIRHLFKHSFDLPRVCISLNIPYIISLHDFYFSCPSVNLLDDRLQFCGGICSKGVAQCHVPTPLLSDLPNLRKFLPKWREQCKEILAQSEALIVMSENTKDIYTKSYPFLTQHPIHLVPHGRNIWESPTFGAPKPPSNKIRILFPGNLAPHRGSHIIQSLLELDRDKRIEAFFAGKVPRDLAGLGRQLGKYRREEFNRIVKKCRPHFIALFSICAETFSNVISEAWLARRPVLVGNLGAQKERVEKSGGGWVLNHRSPHEMLKEIYRIADDREEYERVSKRSASGVLVQSVDQMAARYEAIYKEIIYRKERLSVLLFRPYLARSSFYIRLLYPLNHPYSPVTPTIVDQKDQENLEVLSELIKYSQTRIAIMQWNGLNRGNRSEIITLLKKNNVKIVFDIDDNYEVIEPPNRAEYKVAINQVDFLAKAADKITCSTETLKEIFENKDRKPCFLQPNFLDSRLWLTPVKKKKKLKVQSQEIRALYHGSFTHGQDLELIREEFVEAKKILNEKYNIKLNLYIIGIVQFQRGKWYKAIPIKLANRPYPDFVYWLRSSVRADLAIAPLANTALNQSKSALKFYEYSALGWPAIYSAEGPYLSEVVNEVNGLLAKNDTPGHWTEQIVKLVSQPKLREQISANARKQVMQQQVLYKGNKTASNLYIFEKP